jgi:hypothetical protein
MTAQTIILSIEDKPGHSYMHGFHLGTDLRLARQITEEMFHARVKNEMPVVTMAIFAGNKMLDCYMGDKWMSETSDDDL